MWKKWKVWRHMIFTPLPLSQTVTLSQTPSPLWSVTYFMDGPYVIVDVYITTYHICMYIQLRRTYKITADLILEMNTYCINCYFRPKDSSSKRGTVCWQAIADSHSPTSGRNALIGTGHHYNAIRNRFHDRAIFQSSPGRIFICKVAMARQTPASGRYEKLHRTLVK